MGQTDDDPVASSSTTQQNHLDDFDCDNQESLMISTQAPPSLPLPPIPLNSPSFQSRVNETPAPVSLNVKHSTGLDHVLDDSEGDEYEEEDEFCFESDGPPTVPPSECLTDPEDLTSFQNSSIDSSLYTEDSDVPSPRNVPSKSYKVIRKKRQTNHSISLDKPYSSSTQAPESEQDNDTTLDFTPSDLDTPTSLPPAFQQKLKLQLAGRNPTYDRFDATEADDGDVGYEDDNFDTELSVNEDATLKKPMFSPSDITQERVLAPLVPASHFECASSDLGSPCYAPSGTGSLTPLSHRDRQVVGDLIVNEGKMGALAVRRNVHFSFDMSTGHFTGAPQEWLKELTKKFGLPLKLTRASLLPGYASRIPDILIFLRENLLKNGGFLQKGIFRLAPDAGDCARAKEAINDGTFDSNTVTDVNVYSNLIKIWFRDLPARLLDSSPDTNDIIHSNTPEEAGQAVMKFPEPQLSILLWVLDLCADVSLLEPINAMTSCNLSIVFAPNMYRTMDASPYPIPEATGKDKDKKDKKEKKEKKDKKDTPAVTSTQIDPQATIALCKKYTVFLEKAIDWRVQTTIRPKVSPLQVVSQDDTELFSKVQTLLGPSHQASASDMNPVLQPSS